MKRLVALLALVGSATLASALGISNTVVLEIDPAQGRGVVASPVGSVAVPSGSKLTLQVNGPGRVEWFRNGASLGITSAPQFSINSTAATDAGQYLAVLLDSTSGVTGRPTRSNLVGLSINPGRRFVALSNRVHLNGGSDVAIAGFVIDPGSPAETGAQMMFVRAVGPALTQFGVTDALSRPKLQILRADGKPAEMSFDVIPEGQRERQEVARSAAGLFSLPAGGKDVELYVGLKPGAYTALVTSEDGSAGTVLIEVYEVPAR